MKAGADPPMGAGPVPVLLVHNRYRERGGEDAVVEAEARLLRERGHPVTLHEVDNAEVDAVSRPRLAAGAVWNPVAYRELARLAAATRPAVAHVHNTLPLLSPAVHHALWRAGAAVVQTLHNFRLLCPQGMLLRDGRPCEACVGRLPLPGVVHRCYRGSRSASATVATMLVAHRALRTWHRRVDAFIALSDFARSLFIRGGLPAQRLYVRPNFVDPDPGPGAHRGDYLLFVGRLSEEKGVGRLLEAWRAFGASTPDGDALRLVLVGGGPLAGSVREAAASLPGLRWEGELPHERVLELMGEARALVVPSLCYENFPRVVAEAYARGLPVLASRRGSLVELVDDGRTGRLFDPDDGADLAQALRWPYRMGESLERYGAAARAAYEGGLDAAAGYESLVEIYDAALARRGSSWSRGGEKPRGRRAAPEAQAPSAGSLQSEARRSAAAPSSTERPTAT